MTTYILLPHIQIHNANSLSSTYTIGFPAMTAWLGAVHALQRKLRKHDSVFSQLSCVKTAVICHDCHLQVYQGYRNAIIGTANPLKKNRKTGAYERPSFIAEGRVHVTVSLLIETSGIAPEDKERCEDALQQILPSMKMAGGDIISIGPMEVLYADPLQEEERRQILSKLMPGYVLIERRDLLKEQLRQGEDILTALLRFLTVRCSAESNSEGAAAGWKYTRETTGWIVPIAVGFKRLTPVGRAAKQRDPFTPHCFAESVVTLGEFKLAYRIHDIEEAMWHYEYHDAQGMYLCRNQDD